MFAMIEDSFKILYIHPEELKNRYYFLSGILRISNYLNSRKHELASNIEEEYLDLRFEKLPPFSHKLIQRYRKKLKNLLLETYKRFKFNLIAISCYSSFYYLNSVEIAMVVKNFINPDCLVVVGGPHASIIPEDFNPDNIPPYFYEFYPKQIIPFNYVIREEAEIGFYNLIYDLLKNYSTKLAFPINQFKIITSDILLDLNEVPVIDLSLYEKYQKIINKLGFINIDFCRGCMFRCSFCVNSTDFMRCYKNVRFKDVDLCFEEIKAINETEWLSIKEIHIMDPIFFPNRKYKNQFYIKLRQFRETNKDISYNFRVFDRIDLCSEFDQQNYKELDIIPEIGLESISKKTLYNMNKLNSTNIDKILNYLMKVRKLIEFSNKLQLEISFNYIFSFPGSTKTDYEEFNNFFFNNTQNGQSLMEKYNINITWTFYAGLPRTLIYSECEDQYGSKIYYKEWWKLSNNNQRELCKLIKPSLNLTFGETIDLAEKYFKKMFFNQLKRGNRFYSKRYFSFYKKHLKQLRKEDLNIMNIQKQSIRIN